MVILLTLWGAGCSGPSPAVHEVVAAETPRYTEADVREARAYEYFKRMFIVYVPSCDTRSDFVLALARMGISCDDIKDKSPVEAFKHVRAITNGYATNAVLRRVKLDLYNEADGVLSASLHELSGPPL